MKKIIFIIFLLVYIIGLVIISIPNNKQLPSDEELEAEFHQYYSGEHLKEMPAERIKDLKETYINMRKINNNKTFKDNLANNFDRSIITFLIIIAVLVIRPVIRYLHYKEFFR